MEQVEIIAGEIPRAQKAANEWLKEMGDKIEIVARKQSYETQPISTTDRLAARIQFIAISIWYIRKDEQKRPSVV